jgi:hypothetical protein
VRTTSETNRLMWSYHQLFTERLRFTNTQSFAARCLQFLYSRPAFYPYRTMIVEEGATAGAEGQIRSREEDSRTMSVSSLHPSAWHASMGRQIHKLRKRKAPTHSWSYDVSPEWDSLEEVCVWDTAEWSLWSSVVLYKLQSAVSHTHISSSGSHSGETA